MDSVAQLALMTKAKLVFESPGTFLSFPVLSPLAYAPEELSFDLDGDGAAVAQAYRQMADFARVTNTMPSGVVAPVVSDELLWDVCEDVLSSPSAEVASETVTQAEQERYDTAMAYLYRQPASADQRRQDSPALLAYKQHRDASIKAHEDYKTQELTAALSEDPAVAAAFAAAEPRLRAAYVVADRAWETAGHRNEVEAAQQVELSLAGRSPRRVWDEWRTALIGAIDKPTDGIGSTYAPTVFAPADAVDGDWLSFTLSGAEITSLVAQAPGELAAIFGTSSTGSDLESVSFEYRSVSVVRPWFRPAMLTSRFWRLGPAGGELSDGAAAPAGRCPSYVAGLVLARTIVVKRAAQPPIHLDSAQLRRFMAFQPEIMARLPAATLAGSSIGSTGLAPVAAVIRDHRGATSAPRAAGGVVVRDHRAAGTVVRDHRASFVGIGTVLQGQVFTEATPPIGIPPPPPPPPPPEPVSTDITILAFICRRTARCPDPDPALRWPFEAIEEAPAAEREHVVAPGETLAKIAAKYYGEADRWREIAARNAITDPRTLQIGQRLTIP